MSSFNYVFVYFVIKMETHIMKILFQAFFLIFQAFTMIFVVLQSNIRVKNMRVTQLVAYLSK